MRTTVSLALLLLLCLSTVCSGIVDSPSSDCTDGDVQLVGGASAGEGRVEVCVEGGRATICDDGWDLSDASVVCGELGLGEAFSAPILASYGQGSGPIAFSDVECTGNESSIFNCSNNGLYNSTCTHSEDASVVCSVFRVQFEQTSYTVSEIVGITDVCILSEPASFEIAADVTTNLSITAIDGTATAQVDFILLDDIVTIATSSYVCVRVNIIDDTEPEPGAAGRIFTLSLSTNDSSVELVTNSTSVSIQDNDIAPPTLSVTPPQVVDETGESAIFLCEIVFDGGVRNPYLITWHDSSGEELNGIDEGIVISRNVTTEGGGAMSILNINGLRTSQAGPYSCRGSVDTYVFGTLNLMDSFSIVVEISRPVVFVLTTPTLVYYGSNVTVTCYMGINIFTDIDVIPTIRWEVNSTSSNGERSIEVIVAEEVTPSDGNVGLLTTTLEYNPIQSSAIFKCYGSLRPAALSLYLRASEEGNTTFPLVVPAPPVNLVLSPTYQAIAASPNFNIYTLTCTASVPDDITGLGFTFKWVYLPSGVIISPNASVTIEDSVVNDGGSLSYISTLSVVHPNLMSEVLRIECIAVDSAFDESVFANATVEVKGPALPAQFQLSDPLAIVPSSELVSVQWTVPFVAFTPETYTVEYQMLEEDSLGPILSVEVPGVSDLSSVNRVYNAVIEGLSPSTEYRVRVVSSNERGMTMTGFVSFTTAAVDNVVLLPDFLPQNLSAIPLGASIQLRFQFATSLFGDIFFMNISNAPLQIPSIIYNVETSRATVSYDRASPSLTGDYLLCRRGGPNSRKRQSESFQLDCSNKISLRIYYPSLSVSTNLLVADINGNRESARVSCNPSDPLSPVRWRTALSTYDQFSSQYAVSFDRPLAHAAVFSLIGYEGIPPSMTETFVCDLINVDETDTGVEIDPQMIVVRFLRKPVAILNNDRELQSPTVINTFSSYSNGDEVVSLRCFSDSARNLVWELTDVPSVPSGIVTLEDSESIPFLTIDYLEGAGVNNRDTGLVLSPINNLTTGFYSCQSSDSLDSSSATVLITLEQPFWQFTSSSSDLDLPVGATLSVTALYADFSDGNLNMGIGFRVSRIFEVEGGNTSETVILSGGRTDRFSHEFEYSIIVAGAEDNGLYTIIATHFDTGNVYNQSVRVSVTVPHFVEFDARVIAREGDSVTLRCIPNDTLAPVQWNKFPALPTLDLLNSRTDLFALSPPSLNHTITFDPALVALTLDGFSGLTDTRQLYTSVYQCGFYRLMASRITELTIQREAVRLHYSSVDEKVFNNTVINIYQSFDYGDYRRNVGDYGTGGDHLDIRCLAAQGNHQPLWLTDNPLLRDDLGAVVTEESDNYQDVESDYITRLRLQNVEEPIDGVYTCSSQLTGALQRFTLSDNNPYVVPISPTEITVVEGQELTVRFRVALNSDGHAWDASRTLFSFTSSGSDLGEAGMEELRIPFLILDPDYPQDYVFTTGRVRRDQEGLYTARVAEASDPQCEAVGCGSAEASVIVTIIPACLEEIDSGLLWPDTVQNGVATLPCTMAGSRFRQGTSITRACQPNGVWGSVDFTTCTLDSSFTESLLLVYFSLVDSDLPFAPKETMPDFNREALEAEMSDILENTAVSFSSLSITSLLPTGRGATVSYEIVLTPDTTSSSLDDFNEYVTGGIGLMGFDRYQVDQNAPVGVLLVVPTESCQCGSVDAAGSGLSLNTLELCVGLSLSPCSCSFDGECTCRPPYVGDGTRCTLDSDGDGYPDVALTSPACLEITPPPFCVQDNCPGVTNVNQDPFACQEPQEFDGCPFGVDSVWGIEWPNTERDTTSEELCPGALDSVSGRATRYCGADGEWGEPNVLDCQEADFVTISFQASAAFSQTSDPAVLIEETVQISQQLAVITEPDPIPLLPSSLNTTNTVLTSVLDVLETTGNNTADANEFVIDVLNNILDQNNTQGWMALQEMTAGSQVLLNNAERFGELLARSANNSDQPVRVSRPNIAVSAKLFDSSQEVTPEDLRFPREDDLVNYPSTFTPAEIEIPSGLLQERLSQQNEGDSLAVTFILIRNVEAFLPASSSGLNNSQGASVVISSQVGSRGNVVQSQVLLEDPISLNFTFDTVEDTLGYRCVYWNFSDPVGSGGWVSEGVSTLGNSTTGKATRVQCASTHLTSFAVLVDVAGGLSNISDAERTALQVVSYIGCVISLICLLVTIIFFIAHGKKLLTSVHYFVHLNLSISLFLAYLVFVVGVETAIGSVGGCAFVAALLHYLFLSAFCWMLCEGVMLYLLLVVVFSTVAKKWWFFLLLGYLIPLPFVVVTVAARWQYYGVRDESGNLEFCWLSTEQGTIFGFVAPMLAIILINVVFLAFALRALWKNQRRQVRRAHRKDSDTEKNLKIAKAVLLASVVLLPLLGLTWVFGLLTVNSNTTVFAWIFTILNSLQGLAIFFFHVIRNDKVWGKIRPRIASTFRTLTLRSTYKNSTYDANPKSSTYDGNTSERFKSTTDTEMGLNSLQSSDGGTLKVDLSKSQPESEYTETKIDLAAETDGSKLVTEDEPSGDHVTNKEEDVITESARNTDSLPLTDDGDVIVNQNALENLVTEDSKNENNEEAVTSLKSETDTVTSL